MDNLDPLILDEGEIQVDQDLSFPNPSFYCLSPGNENTCLELPMTIEMKTIDLEETRQTYCTICGDPFSHLVIKKEILEDSCHAASASQFSSSSCYKWTEDECEIFQWLIKSFQLRLAKTCLWRAEEDAFPFCVACKFEVQLLLDLQRKLEEVTIALRNGIEELQQKMGSREEVFANGKIYQKDRRYFKFRNQILGRKKGKRRFCGKVFTCDSSTLTEEPAKSQIRNVFSRKPGTSKPGQIKDLNPLINDDDIDDAFPDPTESDILTTATADVRTTRSGRKSKPVPRLNYLKNNFPVPVVLLKAVDKTKANDHKQNQKVEPLQMFENANDAIVNADAKLSKRQVKKTGLLIADKDSNDYFEESEYKRKSNKTKTEKKTKDPDLTLDDGENSSSEEDYPDTDEEHENFVEKIVSASAENPLKNEKVKTDPITKTVTFKDVLFLRTEDNQYKCDKCSEVFPKNTVSTTFRYHVIRKHLDCLRCKVCSRAFPIFSRFVSHVKSKHSKQHKKPRRRPEDMPKPAPKKPKSSLGVHPNLKIPEEELICPTCQKPTRSRYQLEIHRWSHFSQEERAEIEAQGKLSNAIRVHLQKLQCEECGMRLKCRANLDRHIQSMHSNKECNDGKESKLCPHCGKSYIDLKSHIMRSHPREVGSEAKQYECGICGKIFYSARARRVHKQEVHMQLCTYTCTVCPGKRGFSSKFKYNQHMNAHAGIRPYQCSHCQSAFTVKNHLVRHTKLFHEEGGNPKRPAYIRGMTKKGKEKVENCDMQKTKLNEGSPSSSNTVATSLV